MGVDTKWEVYEVGISQLKHSADAPGRLLQKDII